MISFLWGNNRKVEQALSTLLDASNGDALQLSAADVSAVARQAGVSHRASSALLARLVENAIDCDVRRMIALFHAGGRATMPPPRLIGDWALALGIDAPDVRKLLARHQAPVSLAREYLALGAIGLPQQLLLEDVAAAYGGGSELALAWIAAAVNEEIDQYVELAANNRAKFEPQHKNPFGNLSRNGK